MRKELTRTREVVRGCSFVIRWTKQSKGKVFHYSKLKDSACKHGGQFYISTSSVASPHHFPFFFFLRIYDLTGCSKAARYALEETDRFNQQKLKWRRIRDREESARRRRRRRRATAFLFGNSAQAEIHPRERESRKLSYYFPVLARLITNNKTLTRLNEGGYRFQQPSAIVSTVIISFLCNFRKCNFQLAN